MLQVNLTQGRDLSRTVLWLLLVGCGLACITTACPALAQEPEWKCGSSLNEELLKSMRQYVQSQAGTAGVCDWGPCDDPATRDANIPDSLTPVKYIRLHFHILRKDDASEALSDKQEIIEIVNGMNAAYLPWRIQFTYDWRFANSSQYWYVEGWTEFADIKELLAIEHETHINIYIAYFTADGSDYSWAIYIQEARALTKQGGIIINPQSFPYYTDFVPSHEMGHALGLFHTHAGVSEVPACSACWESVNALNRDRVGDYCSDTEPAPVTFYCSVPSGIDQCSGLPWTKELPENFMSYAFPCNHYFTPQQAGRMHCWVEDRRPDWIAYASFNTVNTFGRAPFSVDFTGLTGYEIITNNWDFGDGTVSQEQSPSHVYAEPGMYSVSLESDTDDGLFADSKSDYIWVYSDTIKVREVVPISDDRVRVDIGMRNYVLIQILKVPVSWDGPADMSLDSISTQGCRTESLPLAFIDDLASSANMAALVLNGLAEDAIQPDSGRIFSLYFTLPGGVEQGVNPVEFTYFGQHYLTAITERGNYVPEIINEPTVTCCGRYTGGYTGNANCSEDGKLTLSDITRLIDRVYVSKQELCCEENGNVNASEDGKATLSDITRLIDNVYITKSPTEPCL